MRPLIVAAPAASEEPFGARHDDALARLTPLLDGFDVLFRAFAANRWRRCNPALQDFQAAWYVVLFADLRAHDKVPMHRFIWDDGHGINSVGVEQVTCRDAMLFFFG